MTRQRVLAALAAAAVAITIHAVPAAAGGPKKFRATRAYVVDRQTGAVRMPTPAEVDAVVTTLTALGQQPDEALPAATQTNGGGGAGSRRRLRRRPAGPAHRGRQVGDALRVHGRRGRRVPRPRRGSPVRSAAPMTSRRPSPIRTPRARPGEPPRVHRRGQGRPGAVRHRQRQRRGRRLQRSDPGRTGGRQHRHHPRRAAADRVHVRGQPLERASGQRRPDPHPRPVHVAGGGCARQRRPDPGLPGLPQRAARRTWYHVALANKLAGVDLSPGHRRHQRQLQHATSTSISGWTTGTASCNDLVTVLLHEFAHGLGFSQTASLADRRVPRGVPGPLQQQAARHRRWACTGPDDQRAAPRVGDALGQGGVGRRARDGGPAVRALARQSGGRREHSGQHRRQLPVRHRVVRSPHRQSERHGQRGRGGRRRRSHRRRRNHHRRVLAVRQRRRRRRPDRARSSAASAASRSRRGTRPTPAPPR